MFPALTGVLSTLGVPSTSWCSSTYGCSLHGLHIGGPAPLVFPAPTGVQHLWGVQAPKVFSAPTGVLSTLGVPSTTRCPSTCGCSQHLRLFLAPCVFLAPIGVPSTYGCSAPLGVLAPQVSAPKGVIAPCVFLAPTGVPSTYGCSQHGYTLVALAPLVFPAPSGVQHLGVFGTTRVLSTFVCSV